MDRTNYFRVKNAEAFEAFAAKFPDVVLIKDEDGRFGLYADDNEAGWPSCDADGEELAVDIVTQVLEHVADDDVAVFVSAGHEKARYATGVACAYYKGEVAQVSIADIYALAKDKFAILPTSAER